MEQCKHRSVPTTTAPLPGKSSSVRFHLGKILPSILCLLLCFPSLSPGEPSSCPPLPPALLPSSLSPPPPPRGQAAAPGRSRGGFSESATVSAESLAVRANGRSFFNQLKWHFLQISLPLLAAKKKPVGRQQGKKTPTQPPPPSTEAAKSPHKLAG